MIRGVLILMILAGANAAPLPLMPMPRNVTLVPGRLKIDSGFSVAVAGYSDFRLEAAVGRFVARVARQTGLPIMPAKPATLTVHCRERAGDNPVLGEDESYRLEISSTGARLQARTPTGALRGLETFLQLIAPGPDGFEVPAVQIEDQPRFAWRGLMLDVSRHWMPVDVVERNLDAMAAVKLNVFHWHLSDDQGFRVESKRFPRLQQYGSDGHFYTQAEIRQVVAFARDRGIRVVPEFDMPAHTTAWFTGYPELASAPGPYTIERKWGVFEPAMDPTRESTYAFLDGLIGEMAVLFPDPYFHIGGDEVVETQWKNSASIQAFAREHHLETGPALHAYFNRRLETLLKKHGKTMIGWDEILGSDLGPQTVVQSWRGQAAMAEAAAQGHASVLSYGYYLDYLKPAGAHYAIDPVAGLKPEEAARVLGGEACMWTEYVSAETVESRIWPRLAAIAERFWSSREVTDVESMYARLDAVSRWLEWTGARHRSGYQPMLDRLAGDRPATALRVLADASEALGIEGRRTARQYTSLVPLNRFVDAVRPESEEVRRLEQAVANFASDPAAAEELNTAMAEWASVAGRITVPELAPLAGNLAAIGRMGLEALRYLERGQQPPAAWAQAQRQELDRLEQPVAEVKLAAGRVVRALLALQIRSQTAENGDVRGRNEPPRNGGRNRSELEIGSGRTQYHAEVMLWAAKAGNKHN